MGKVGGPDKEKDPFLLREGRGENTEGEWREIEGAHL